MGSTPRTATRRLQGIPWAARPQDTEEGRQRLARIAPGPMAPERMGLARGEQGRDARPQRIRKTPVIGVFLRGLRPQQGSYTASLLAYMIPSNHLLG
jgi:hypothetical protein